MDIELNELLKKDLFFDEDVVLPKSYYEKSEIKDLNNIHFKGSITYNDLEVVMINFKVTGNMTLIDDVSLEEINWPLDFEIEEEMSLNDEYFKEYYQKDENTLDILAILWQNIVLEVPMRHTTHENAEASGEGWSLGVNKKEEIDPRLAKLNELVGKRKE